MVARRDTHKRCPQILRPRTALAATKLPWESARGLALSRRGLFLAFLLGRRLLLKRPHPGPTNPGAEKTMDSAQPIHVPLGHIRAPAKASPEEGTGQHSHATQQSMANKQILFVSACAAERAEPYHSFKVFCAETASN